MRRTGFDVLMSHPFTLTRSPRLRAGGAQGLGAPCSWTDGGLNPARWRVADAYESRRQRVRIPACLPAPTARCPSRRGPGSSP
jgi:hypothetical protein